MIRRLLPLGVLIAAAVLLLAGCGGGGGSGSSFPTIGAAKTFQLGDFEPAGPIQPNKPTPISFVIRQPDGQPLTKFKRGPGPHTGVHLIVVADDLSGIVHKHPPIAKDGTIRETLTLPPGKYRMVVDAYPATGPQPNFQLFRPLTVSGKATPQPLPPPATTVTTDGYRFAIRGQPEAEGDPGEAARRSTSPARTGSRRRSRRTTARWPTRSSSARARSTTSTPTSARPARAAAPRRSAARRSSARRRSRGG